MSEEKEKERLEIA